MVGLELAKDARTLMIACCIRRAWRLPPGPFLEEGQRNSVRNEHYWYTRESCEKLARSLEVFYPEVISQFEYVTSSMSDEDVARWSDPFWLDVVYPDLLVSEVMDS